LPLARAGGDGLNPPVQNSPPPAAWEKLLDGRFDSQRPGRTLWNLFSDQPGRVAVAVTLYIIKQTPASLLPLAVGMIVDALTTGGARRPAQTRSRSCAGAWRRGKHRGAAAAAG
jgi:hypothetical protein